MPRKKLLNVKTHLEHLQLIFDGLEEYGMCPAIEAEIKKAAFINKKILETHAAKATRKDIYVNRQSD